MTQKPRRQEQEPATEEVTEPAPGVIRLQLPVHLPGLGHVNCYVVEDERGIAVVDPGLPGKDAWNAFEQRLSLAGFKVKDVHTAVITHSHFDHFGGVTRLADETGAQVLTHERFHIEWADQNPDEGSSDQLERVSDEEIEARIDEMFSEKLPWGTQRTRPPREDIERMKKLGRFTKDFARAPTPTIRVADTDPVMLGKREWVAVHTPGHTEDHLCLFDPDGGTMLSGDHVLPTITPHISGFSSHPDPLADFFESLHRMEAFTGVNHVLPAHGHPFDDLAGRARDIREHHEERLDVVRDAADQLDAGTVTEYMKALFRERSWGDMAESETYAHLEHLRITGDIIRTDPDGIAHYSKAR